MICAQEHKANEFTLILIVIRSFLSIIFKYSEAKGTGYLFPFFTTFLHLKPPIK